MFITSAAHEERKYHFSPWCALTTSHLRDYVTMRRVRILVKHVTRSRKCEQVVEQGKKKNGK